MSTNRILILGGYGNTGLPLARLLLAATDARLILAGRSPSRAQGAAAQLNTEFEGQRTSSVYIDASDSASLRRGLDGVSIAVVASSTAAYVQLVAKAALAAGCDYLDLQYSAAKLAVLQKLAPEIEAAGRCFITDGGFHPGLPAVMVRYVAPCFDRLESAIVASVIKVDWSGLNLSPSTLDEFVGEFRDFQTLHFRDGRWQSAGLLAMLMPHAIDFGGAWGRQSGMPMFLEELRSLPESYPSLREVGFFVGGFNWFVDWFLSPVILGVLQVAPHKGVRPMARLMRWGLNAFSRPPYGTRLKLEAKGFRGNAPKVVTMSIAHVDGYLLTAIPVAACLRQYLDGSIRKPGLWLQAHIVEPERFMRDVARLGAEVYLNEAGQGEVKLSEVANPF
jgi:saccharopine dehydrogenase-like NADP-dependent oxidoreductase